MEQFKILDLDRNDVLEINGERYEVLNHQAEVRTRRGHEAIVELNRIGEPPQEPRFLLHFDDDIQMWERDQHTGELIDVPVTSVAVLEI